MTSEYKYFSDLAGELAAIPPDSIVSRTLIAESALRVILFGFAPGQELTEHRTPMAAIIQILDGEGTLTLGGETMDATPGTAVYMPPNLPHSVQARTELKMLLTMAKEAQGQ